MTPRERFDAAYLRVCHAHGVAIDADHADECYVQSRAFDAALYNEAATRLNAVCRWLPKPAEWRAALGEVDAARRQTPEAATDAPAPTDGPWCPHCDDTGWRTTRTDPPTVAACSCRRDNPVYRHRQRRQVPRITPEEAARIARDARGY